MSEQINKLKRLIFLVENYGVSIKFVAISFGLRTIAQKNYLKPTKKSKILLKGQQFDQKR